ncbi:MAG TPA: class I SAM-dependent methyltransferase [Beijerinckiaceae bacterium]|nr:class I SAM-dependent methyltransferase [Beijerinckiaceae bacterium]
MRTRLRRLGFGLSTLVGLAPRGFFIPYRYAAGASSAGYPALVRLFEAAEPRFREVIGLIAAFGPDLDRIAKGGGSARFDQDWFPRLDAAAAYSLVRTRKPNRIVEIGSGHSTRFLARAAADGGLAAEILCIDPAPRTGLSGLGVSHVPTLLHEADPRLLGGLEAGDVLFIDSSHIAMPGTDVDRLFLDVLPRLPPGVLVHVHDVFLPDPYPAEWAWRGYNEQLLVGALLQGGGCDLVFASRYVAAHRPDWLTPVAHLPLRPGAFETSLWFETRRGS